MKSFTAIDLNVLAQKLEYNALLVPEHEKFCTSVLIMQQFEYLT